MMAYKPLYIFIFIYYLKLKIRYGTCVFVSSVCCCCARSSIRMNGDGKRFFFIVQDNGYAYINSKPIKTGWTIATCLILLYFFSNHLFPLYASIILHKIINMVGIEFTFTLEQNDDDDVTSEIRGTFLSRD
jgi:hypothetical protein